MSSNNRNYWLKSGSLNLILNIQALIFGFGGFFFLVRMLDKHSFGIWVLFTATTTIFETIRGGLVQNALIRFLSGSSKEDHPDILSASFFISAILIILCIVANISLAGYFARIWNYPALVQMFLLYNLVYVFQAMLLQFQWIEQAHFSFIGVLITNTIKQGGFFFYVAFCFFLKAHISLISLIYLQVICAFAGMVTEYFFVKEFLSASKKISRKWVVELFNYGKYVFGTSVSAMLSSTINQMMLGAMVSPDAAGVYNVAMRVTTVADLPTNAIGTAVFPQSSRRFAEQGSNAGKYMYEKSVGTILALLIPALFLLLVFSNFVVNIIAGTKYTDAIPILHITIVTCVMNPFFRLFGVIMDSMGSPKTNFLTLVLYATLNLSFTFFFVKWMQVMGAVYATLVTDIIFFIVIQVLLKKKFNVNFFNSFAYAVKFYPEFTAHYLKPIYAKVKNRA
ncbi:MAG: oligosaccharide flippase family protein [Bacteroidetes bacterium]|nr:oligosaccharide flippase family protein [Bacteroidota bacterium]